MREHSLTSELEQAIVQQKMILPKVSRTFALTIPQLPQPLDTVVTTAYLLCRIADTIEDDARLDARAKERWQNSYLAILQEPTQIGHFKSDLLDALSPNMPSEERRLITEMEHVLLILRSFTPQQQAILHKHITIMCRGMSYFSHRLSQTGLRDMHDFDCYCYAVAGVVGELLTELFCDYLPIEREQRNNMLRLGVSFGQALQMTNILKDIHDDSQRGVCWLPNELFTVSSKKSAAVHQVVPDTVMRYLVGHAHVHCQSALDFVFHIPSKEQGMRRFCLWALGMAIETLNNIIHTPNFKQTAQVKITRTAVKRVMLTTRLIGWSNPLLRLWFRWRCAHLPISEIRDDWNPQRFQRHIIQQAP